MKVKTALPTLESVLRDENEDPMVRHEVRLSFEYISYQCLVTCREKNSKNQQAAEAMGAISSSSSLTILREFLTDSNRSVRETCEIALAKIEWDNSPEGQKHALALNSSDNNNTSFVSLLLSYLNDQ